MAQWIARQTSNLKVVGSSPTIRYVLFMNKTLTVCQRTTNFLCFFLIQGLNGFAMRFK
jgi:hypothetical protein